MDAHFTISRKARIACSVCCRTQSSTITTPRALIGVSSYFSTADFGDFFIGPPPAPGRMPQRTGGGHVGKTHFSDADRPHPLGRARHIGGHASHGRGLARQGLQLCRDFFPFSFTESGTYPAGVLEFAVFIWDGE